MTAPEQHSPSTEPSAASAERARPDTDPADQTERFVAMLSEALGEEDPLAGGDCSVMLERLYFFLDGELTEERRALVEAHLQSCNTCGEVFDFEAELRLVLRDRVATQVPPSLLSRISNALRHDCGDDDDHAHHGDARNTPSHGTAE